MSCNYFYSLIVFYFFNISEFCDLKTIDNLKPGFNTRISRNRASRLLFDVFHTLHLEYEDCRVVHPSNLKKGVFELKSFQNFQSYYGRKIKKSVIIWEPEYNIVILRFGFPLRLVPGFSEIIFLLFYCSLPENTGNLDPTQNLEALIFENLGSEARP